MAELVAYLPVNTAKKAYAAPKPSASAPDAAGRALHTRISALVSVDLRLYGWAQKRLSDQLRALAQPGSAAGGQAGLDARLGALAEKVRRGRVGGGVHLALLTRP